MNESEYVLVCACAPPGLIQLAKVPWVCSVYGCVCERCVSMCVRAAARAHPTGQSSWCVCGCMWVCESMCGYACASTVLIQLAKVPGVCMDGCVCESMCECV